MTNLRFIYGRAGSGKTRFCLKQIKEQLEAGEGHPLVLLVPEQYTFQAERDLINVLGTGGILQIEVLSFRRLAFRIFNQAGGITYPHIHSAGKCMLLHRILDRHKTDWQVFAKAADRQGFVNTIANLITEFKRYAVTPGKLREAAQGLPENDLLKEKLDELSIVYAEYEETIARRYRDTDDDLSLAAQMLDSCDLYSGAEIWIDGFSGFTPQEYKVLAELAKKAGRINIALCTDSLEDSADGTDVFSAVKRVYQRFKNLAEETGLILDAPVHLDGQPLPRFAGSPELSHLERYLYAFPYRTHPDKTLGLSLYAALNPFAEIEATAAEIVSLCRDQGMRYRDIAVVTPSLAAYERLIQVVFAAYDIPYFLDRKLEITNHPLARLILAMLDIFNEQWSYEAVFRYLKTGLTGIDRERIYRLENYVLACGIRGNRWTKDEAWQMSPDFLPDEKDTDKYRQTLAEINAIRKEITGPLLEFRARTKGRKTASAICTALYDFLCTLAVPARIERMVERFRQNGQLDLANEYGQVWNIMMDVLDQTVEVMGEESFGLQRFTDILKIGLAEYQVGLIPASLDQVLVGSVERSRSHEIKALFILGANDGVFPSAILEEGILSDQDRKALAAAGIELAGDTRTQAFDEQYLIYRTLTTPQNYLRLSWPIADQEGKSLRPSIIVSRLRKLFPAIKESSGISQALAVEEEIKRLAGKATSFQQMITALRRRADRQEIHPVWEKIYRWYAAQAEWQPKCEAMRAAFAYRNTAEPVSAGKVLALYGNPAYAGVSRLEKYSSCPFAYFVQYGLGARERKIYRLTPPDVGTFLHAVIEKFSHYVAEQNISWRAFDREWCAQKVAEIIEEMLEKMQGSGLAASKRYKALLIRLQRVVSRAVWLIAEHIRRSSFEPVGYEVGFGQGEKFPPIRLELAEGRQINLVGRIDRVDALKTEEGAYLRIIDYKSGAKDFKLADVYYGLQIQLLTYLDALAGQDEFAPESTSLPGGVLYFRIDDPLVRANGKMTEEQIEQAIMKQLRMKGLLLADVKLIREMDKTIDGSSLIIPARINKGDVLGRSSAASLEQFHLLKKYVKKLLTGIGEEIMRGNVAIQPYKKKKETSCRYCSYGAVCQFDPIMQDNHYKLLADHKDETVWELLSSEGGEA